ncbi:sialate O-acetylesterase [Planctomycetales bacterium ZRK34]|nr:sialate O-acetylesterase [Planctomycetales bacterium ZRK34]
MALVACLCTMTLGAVKLPGFFNDHMVLQRQMPIAVWGWADPGEMVEVTLGDDTVKTTANQDGQWKVALPKREAGGPLTLSIVSPSGKITINDVLVGEVWLCSGQSNMEWTVNRSNNAQAEIAAATDDQIRHIKIPRVPSPSPREDISAPWQVCSPDTAGNFTAAGYFMAVKLRKELNVPIGLINSSWGGTRIEPWTPPVGFEMVPALKWYVEWINKRTPTNPAYRKGIEDYIAKANQWIDSAEKALKSNQAVAPMPAFPDDLKQSTNHQDPTMLYNGMIHALVGYSMRGAIWYQGESNHGEGMMYYEKTKALVEGWRKLWGIGDFPYYYVQIAPYQYGNEPPHVLAEFWEAQAACEQIPNTGMVVINDIATLNNIHPPNKQDVGDRLARLALHRTYGREDVVDSGPTFKAMKIEGDSLRITFDNTAGGLTWRDGKPGPYFQIIGEGAGWQTADAKIDGDSVILTSPKVKKPAAMRFAWHKLAEPNLVNGAGLPTSAFRAGEVPKPDFLSQIDDAAGYKLVYDVDLAKLPNISYTQDNAKAAGKFDRVAYLLELQPGNDAARYVWVSMKAFTDDASKLGVPTAASGAFFAQKVDAMTVSSNVDSIKAGANLPGNIEFWPNNYGTPNVKAVPGADNAVYDTGDQPAEPRDGYGCMQIHNYPAKQTIMAFNNWKAGSGADLGIGNSEGKTRDWTFNGNAGSYAYKRLRIFVRPAN